MNIVFVTIELASQSNSSGGLASFTANMARIFASRGHHVHIVLASTKEQHIEFQEGIEVISLYVPMETWTKMDRAAKALNHISRSDRVSITRAFVNLYKARQVRQAIKNIDNAERIDIIHYCNHGSLNRLSPVGIPYIVRLSGFINIWFGGANTPDGSLEYKKNPLSIRDRLEEFTIRKARFIVSPSYLLARIAKENLGKKVTIIESPFVLNKKDWDYTVWNFWGLNQKKYIIHFGSLKYLKGTHIVAQIAKEFLMLHPDFYLVLAGNNEDLLADDGTRVKADELVRKQAGVYADRVIYAGRLVREQLYPVIQNAELCFLPSRIENLSNACIEAMAMGKIVVATNGASYEQLIDDRVSGFLCERDNPDSFLKALNEALSMDNETKMRMTSKATERIEQLAPDVIYKKYLEFYQGVIQKWGKGLR